MEVQDLYLSDPRLPGTQERYPAMLSARVTGTLYMWGCPPGHRQIRTDV